ncbi:MAG: protein phosphatase 2C domain-containing protein [archaeon]
MEAYVTEKPGRTHDYNEDSHYNSIIKDINGKDCGLFMVADGCSDDMERGSIASHMIVNKVGDELEFRLKNEEIKDYQSIIRDAIVKVNTPLANLGSAHSTLSLLIVRENRAYVGHLGDCSIIFVYDDKIVDDVVKNESKGSYGPTNYVGVDDIDGREIEERINYREFDFSEEKPSFIMIHSDGVDSRISKEHLNSILLDKSLNYFGKLREIEDEINLPRKKMLEIGSIDELKRKILLRTSLHQNDYQSIEELVDDALDSYIKRNDDQLLENIDLRRLKYDDTTIMFIDLEDSVKKNIIEIKDLKDNKIPELEKEVKKIPNLQKEKDYLHKANSELESKLSILFDEKEEIIEVLNNKKEEIKQYQNEVDEMHKKINHLNNKYESLEKRCNESENSWLNKIFNLNKTKKKELEKLAIELDSEKQKKVDFEEKLSNKEREYSEVDKLCKGYSIIIDDLNSVIENFAIELDSEKQKRVDFEEKLSNKEREYSEVDKLCKGYNIIIDDLNSVIENFVIEKNRLSETRTDNNKKIIYLETELENVKNKNSNNLFEAKNLIERLSKKNSQYEIDCEEKDKQLQEKELEIKKLYSELQNENEQKLSLESENEQLRDSLQNNAQNSDLVQAVEENEREITTTIDESEEFIEYVTSSKDKEALFNDIENDKNNQWSKYKRFMP